MENRETREAVLVKAMVEGAGWAGLKGGRLYCWKAGPPVTFPPNLPITPPSRHPIGISGLPAPALPFPADFLFQLALMKG